MCFIGTIALASCARPHSGERTAGNPQDEVAAIQDAINDYLADWQVGDSASLASHYDEGYDWMNPVGMHLTGAGAVAQFQAASLGAQDARGVKRSLSYDVHSIRLITPDVAVVDITYTQIGQRPPPPPGTARVFAVWVKRDGRWLKAAQRNFRLLTTP